MFELEERSILGELPCSERLFTGGQNVLLGGKAGCLVIGRSQTARSMRCWLAYRAGPGNYAHHNHT